MNIAIYTGTIFSFDLPSVIIEKRTKMFKEGRTKVNYSFEIYRMLACTALYCYLPCGMVNQTIHN